jgi:hypothetical protein
VSGSDRIAANTEKLRRNPLKEFNDIIVSAQHDYDKALITYAAKPEERRGKFDKDIDDAVSYTRNLGTHIFAGLAEVAAGRDDSVVEMIRILRDAGDIADDLAGRMPGGGSRSS